MDDGVTEQFTPVISSSGGAVAFVEQKRAHLCQEPPLNPIAGFFVLLNKTTLLTYR